MSFGSHAYVGDSETGLVVVDVSDPAAPRQVGALGTPVWASGVFVTGGRAYLVSDSLTVLDVSIPTAPLPVGALDLPASSWGPFASSVHVSGSHAFVTGGAGGLMVVRDELVARISAIYLPTASQSALR